MALLCCGRFGERTALVNGLAAALLAVCATELQQPVACHSSDPSASPERIAGNTVVEVVSSRIGMASYFSCFDALLQRPEVAQLTERGSGPSSANAGKLCPYAPGALPPGLDHACSVAAEPLSLAQLPCHVPRWSRISWSLCRHSSKGESTAASSSSHV